jgi:hypothetical protein
VLDELRDHLISYLSQNHVCVIAANGLPGACAVVAQYENDGLELNCRLPRWSDAAFYLEQEPHVTAIIQDVRSALPRWMQYRGVACTANAMDDRYVFIHITPERIDLIDESRGWGARETLEL